MDHLRAGILIAAPTCPHCSRPVAGAAERCACGASDASRPRRGFAEVFFTAGGA